MGTRTIDHLSSRVCLVRAHFNNTPLGSATGFFVKNNGVVYFITNWHVLSGRKPYDGQPMNDMGAVPNRIDISCISEDLQSGGYLEIDLDDADGRRRWIEHPNGKEVDVAAIRIEAPMAQSLQTPDIEGMMSVDMKSQIGSSAVVIGYPFGDSTTLTGHPLPIWKTGHIASEPEFDYKNKPAILLDVTGRSGMSGSPVFIRTNDYQRESDHTRMVSSDILVKFLGVYSGRLKYQIGNDTESDSNLSTELGLIWRPETILAMLP